MDCCNWKHCVPKKFLYCYPLKTGAYIVGFTMFLLSLIYTIVAIVQTAYYTTDCKAENCDTTRYAWRQSLTVHVVACLQGIAMTCLQVWLLWGIRFDRSPVLLWWVGLTGFWLAQSTAMTINMLVTLYDEVHIVGWAISFIFLLIAFILLVYGISIVHAYWLESNETIAELPAEPVSGGNQ